MDFLHEHPNFRDLLEITAREKKIDDPYLVEKDYWIMHCLWGLKQLGFQYHLKGGTSLSKGFQCIHRFSEDIDIKIEPDEKKCGFKVYTGKNHDKPNQATSRKNFFNWIQKTLNGKINGLTDVVGIIILMTKISVAVSEKILCKSSATAKSCVKNSRDFSANLNLYFSASPLDPSVEKTQSHDKEKNR